MEQLPTIAAIGAATLGAYGAVANSSWVPDGYRWGPAVVGPAYAAGFFWCLRRAKLRDDGAVQETKLVQLVLVLALVALSFALHILYLPAGICCFFSLMFTKNDLLLPPTREKRE